MEPSIDELTAQLILTNDEKAAVVVEEVHTRPVVDRSWLCLVGRLLTHRPFNTEALRTMLVSMWKPSQGMQFKVLGDNLFLFQFNHFVDKKRVFFRGPWRFDKQLLLLEEFEGSLRPSDIKFTRALFWVQVINLPLISMTRAVGILIGNRLGRFVDMELSEEGVAWGKYLRIRVSIDIAKPLRHGMHIALGSFHPVWVSFRYERLPNFCFAYGILGHGTCDYAIRLLGSAVDNSARFQYGPWLQTDMELGKGKGPSRPFEPVEKELVGLDSPMVSVLGSGSALQPCQSEPSQLIPSGLPIGRGMDHAPTPQMVTPFCAPLPPNKEAVVVGGDTLGEKDGQAPTRSISNSKLTLSVINDKGLASEA
ncbi:Uncharacterized protein LOK49_LG01G03918 [Camellia lanceoleosa]|uniref:Uncharacterized protein n=1 Tax=Camellia lanceoleosa TaxID=1840588 RepID=A0ACC0J5M7_9ERIC|nr:Uncharacterized protein LOK49_LG01G03918 [Camellia lanceoleosa]